MQVPARRTDDFISVTSGMSQAASQHGRGLNAKGLGSDDGGFEGWIWRSRPCFLKSLLYLVPEMTAAAIGRGEHACIGRQTGRVFCDNA